MRTTDIKLKPLNGDLDRFEEILEKNVTSTQPLLNEAARHIVLAGGKRLRPAIVIGCAYSINGIEPTTDEVLQGACAIELVHAGSLHHDDVIDNASTRRAIPSVNAQYSNTVAILSGDYLLSIASQIAASLGAQISLILAQTISQLTIGQIIEQQDLYNPRRSKEDYLKTIEGKTAYLFASACKIGAILAGGSTNTIDALYQYGYNIGMAFQIIDDLLDITTTSDNLGKPTANDLQVGVYTLPVILAAQNDARVKEMLGDHLDKSELDEILVIAREPSFINATFNLAKNYGLKAAESLAHADINDEVRDEFTHIINNLINRCL